MIVAVVVVVHVAVINVNINMVDNFYNNIDLMFVNI
jgi:hypothetical protein